MKDDPPTPAQAGTVHIQLFAAAKEAAGGRQWITLQLCEPADAAETLRQVGVQVPELAPLTKRSRLAVNDRYVSDETPIHVGMELALIPPVSGG